MREQTRAESVRAKGKSEGPRAPRGEGRGWQGEGHSQPSTPSGKGQRGTHGAEASGARGRARRRVLQEQGTGRGPRSGLLGGWTAGHDHHAGAPRATAHLHVPTLPKVPSPIQQGLTQDDCPKGAWRTLPTAGALLRVCRWTRSSRCGPKLPANPKKGQVHPTSSYPTVSPPVTLHFSPTSF